MNALIMLLTCAAALAAATPKATAPTFHKDVLPILQSKCQSCHRPGEVAPMSFLTYSSTRPWAKAIREAVMTKRMPPWFADAPHGAFANDPSLSKDDIASLAAWADSGAQEGDPKTAPAPLKFLDGWNISKPDAVIEMPEPYLIPASGAVEYQHIVIPTGFTEDKWVQAVEIRPGNRRLVHHIIAFVRPPGSRWMQHAKPGLPVTRAGMDYRDMPVEETPEFLLSYTPGRPPAGLPEGQARLIKAGSDIVFQIHYTPNGTAGTDRSKAGLVFAKHPPRERVATLPIRNNTFVIPPGDSNFRVDASAKVERPARLLRLIPHMHLRGKAFEVKLANSDGAGATLLRVPRYDFNWQNAYVFREPVTLSPGARIDCTAWFDNSPNNPHNPDPKAEVRWGDQSWEEMMLNYVDVAIPADAEPRRVLARPAGASATPAIRDRFIGVWKLISYKRHYKDGRIGYPYGEHATGRITYDKSGRMSAQLMNPERPKPAYAQTADGIRAATADEMRKVLTGFIAYYGKFDVDEANRNVIHHVESCINPAWVGTDLRRSYEFSGNRMTLTVAYEDGAGVLIWEREPD